MANPIWLDLLKTAATVGATVVAAVWAKRLGESQRSIASEQSRTAVEQKQIAAAKLNLELFEKRYEIFLAVWKFLTQQFEGAERAEPEKPRVHESHSESALPVW